MPYEVSRSGPQIRDIAPNHEHRCSVAQEIGSPSVLLCPFIVNWARSWLLLASLHALQAGGRPQHDTNLSRNQVMVSREHRKKNNGSNVAQRCRLLSSNVLRGLIEPQATVHGIVCDTCLQNVAFVQETLRNEQKLSQPGLSETQSLPEWFSMMHLHTSFRPLLRSHELSVASIPSRIYTRCVL
jgi:hypothetical protein